MSTTSSPTSALFPPRNLPNVRPLTPQALQSGINLSRPAKQHYSRAGQILVSHSDDESLSHTMSSVSPQPSNNFCPIEQPHVLRGPRLPETPWSYLIGPPVTRSSVLVQTPANTKHGFCVAHTYTHAQTTNLNSVHPTVHFLTASKNVFKLSSLYSNSSEEYNKTIII